VESVRSLRHASFPVSRYPTTPYYTIDLALTIGNRAYCVSYETPVLNEVRDLTTASETEIGVVLTGKNVLLILQDGRKIHGSLTNLSRC